MIKRNASLALFTVVALSCQEQSMQKDIEILKYANGSIRHIKRYNNQGKLHGQVQWFYPTGVSERIVNFKDGAEQGNAYYFYPSGALQHFRHWRNGKMNGYVADYFDDTVGIIKHILHYNESGDLIYKKTFDSLGNFVSEEGTRP